MTCCIRWHIDLPGATAVCAIAPCDAAACQRANPMIFRLFRRTPRDGSIASLYGMIVAQARPPAFYQSYGVPDTVNGRLEMLMLHAVLLLRRVWSASRRRSARSARGCSTVSAATWTTACARWEWAISPCREKCAGSGEAFYGRQAAYRSALADGRPSRRLRRPLPAMYLPARRRTRARHAACSLCARGRAAGSPSRTDSSAAQLAFPDPERVFHARVRQTDGAIRRRLNQRRRVLGACRSRSAQVPESGRHLDLVADERTRAAIARLAGLAALPRLWPASTSRCMGAAACACVGRVIGHRRPDSAW